MTRRIVIVVLDGYQPLDVTGPSEVFGAASRLANGDAYAIEVRSPTGSPVRSTSGIGLLVDGSLGGCHGAIDTLIVAGGDRIDIARHDARLIGAITRLAGRSRRVASVCNGALLLAEAGILDGHHAVTHWFSCQTLANDFPAVTVDPDRIFVSDGRVHTSAGVTTGIDLSLALVADDLGPGIAHRVARWLVVFVQRPGGQAQFSETVRLTPTTDQTIADLVAWLPANLADDCSVPALAARVGVSERTFARRFRAATGRTPAAHVESLRVEAAKRELERSSTSLSVVARTVGFGTIETMHRSFRRLAGTTPETYRSHFARSPRSPHSSLRSSRQPLDNQPVRRSAS